MDAVLLDLRYAARALRRAPGLLAVVIATLTVGIGAVTAIFSVVNAVLLRPLPFDEPARVVQVWSGDGVRAHGPTSPANFLDWRAATRAFDAVAAEDFRWFNLPGGAGAAAPPRRLYGALVSAAFFRAVGARPVLGRGFAPDEERVGARVVVLGHAVWAQRFGGDRAVIGRTVTLDGEAYQVVGVMPPGFDFPGPLVGTPVDLWVPLAWAPGAADRGIRRLGITARLGPGVSLARAQREADAVAARLAALHPRENEGVRIRLVPLREELVGASERPLLVLLGAVGLVLLIACANVANLLLARAHGRDREVALRAALGARRGRIARQLLAESVLLALAGGALGTLMAMWLTQTLVALAPEGLPRAAEIAVDARALLFALATSVLTGVLFGAAPALALSGASLGDSLRQGGRALTVGRGRRRLRHSLVVAEMGMALVLLVGAGLLLRSLDRLLRVDPGFDPAHVLTAAVDLPPRAEGAPERGARFVGEALDRLAETPGVTHAAAIDYLPFARGDAYLDVSIEGRRVATPAEQPAAHYRAVGGDYLAAMRIPLLAGRALSRADRADAPPVAVVNAAFVRAYWRGAEPASVLGRRVRAGSAQSDGPWLTVVGVVGDVKHWGLDDVAAPELYRPLLQAPSAHVHFVVRGAGDAAALAAPVRRALRAVDADQPVTLQPLSALVSASTVGPRFRSALLGAFASVALVLALGGIYGVISYGVAQRTREIGVRLALGAQRVEVVGLVLREGMRLTALGLTLGLAGALALTRLLRGLLFQVPTTDAVTFAGVSLLLAAAALAANYIPARRAARGDPLAAIRAE